MRPVQIVTNAGELAAFAAALPPDSPVVIEPSEREIGAETQLANYAVVVKGGYLPVNESGQIAGPGEKIGIVERTADDGTVVRGLKGIPTLTLTERYLATPGVLGEHTEPLDPRDRLDAAYERSDGDMTTYLMELVAAVDYLRDEVASAVGDEDKLLHPAAIRRLATAAEQLDGIRAVLSDATRYGVACELARLHLRTDTECDAELEGAVRVHLDGLGYDELACPQHAAEAVQRLDASIASISAAAARAKLLAALGEHHLPLTAEDE